MRFSVIIPCYNAAKTIERALDSLVHQSFCDWEVICIDDCSKDNTVEVINRYKEKSGEERIILLQNDKNSGPGDSRNKGISVAKGEYICLLDSDDYYDFSTFQVLNEKIEESDADIVFYGCNHIIGNTLRRYPSMSRDSISDYMALVSGSLCMGTWRRSLWDRIELPSISNAEDIAVIPILISRAKTIVAIGDYLYNYVHSNTSTSSRHHPQVSYNFVSSFHYTLEHVDVDEFHDSIEFHGIKTIIYGATLNAIKAGMNNDEITELWTEFNQRFPLWGNNSYLTSYNCSKRLFVWLAGHHLFILMRVYAMLHSVLLKKLG